MKTKIKTDYLEERIKDLKELTEIYDKQIHLEKQAELLRNRISNPLLNK